MSVVVSAERARCGVCVGKKQWTWGILRGISKKKQSQARESQKKKKDQIYIPDFSFFFKMFLFMGMIS